MAGRKIYGWPLTDSVRIIRDKPKQVGRLTTRYQIMQRDGFRCQLCGRTAKEHGVVLEVDHNMARANGGTDADENRWTRCWDCNRGKSDKSL